MKWNILKKEFSSEISMTKKILKKLLFFGVIIAILSYPLSGFYLVRTNETGVLKRFGKIIDDRVPPGLHYRFPRPIDTVARLSTREINRFQCGFGVDPDLGERDKIEDPFESPAVSAPAFCPDPACTALPYDGTHSTISREVAFCTEAFDIADLTQ